MSGDLVCYLEITRYAGWVELSFHYYGSLRCDGHQVELIRTLTTHEAAVLNQGNIGKHPYRKGGTYPGFDDKDALVAMAVNDYKSLFPHARVLVLGGGFALEHQPILDRREWWPVAECSAQATNAV